MNAAQNHLARSLLTLRDELFKASLDLRTEFASDEEIQTSLQLCTNRLIIESVDVTLEGLGTADGD